MPQITLDEIEQTVRRALTLHGAAPFAAAEVACAVRAAESVGNKICGLYYVESYCQQLRTGRVSGTVTPQVSTPRGGAVVVDAGFGFAQPAFAHALPVALDAARRNGVASLSVAHAHTCTALGYFTQQIAQARRSRWAGRWTRAATPPPIPTPRSRARWCPWAATKAGALASWSKCLRRR